MEQFASTIAVIATCYNRRELTVQAINAIMVSASHAKVRLRIYLTDDGCTDDTPGAVLRIAPQACIISGNGNLYWNRGMLAAWTRAVQDYPDFFLWLNDDLVVKKESLENALALFHQLQSEHAIVVGHTVDKNGEVTYGAYQRANGISKLRFRHLNPSEQFGVTMNGNFVLIPRSAVEDIGLLDSNYRHAYGDVDYGLRASGAGYMIAEIKTPVGSQERNAKFDAAMTSMRFHEWRYVLTHPKGVSVAEWMHFCKRHGGYLWPVNFIFRYLKMLAKGLSSPT